jgi:glycosyltransferase involved in cell wall biosynthesis
MRLLLLDQFSDLGGAQQCLLDLLPAIAVRGWKALIGMPGTGEMFARVRELGCEAETISCGPYGSGPKSARDMARFAVDTPGLVSEIRRLAARIDAELLYVNGPRLLPAAALARLSRPVIFHAHSYLAPGMMRQIAAASLCGMKARVVAQSKFVGEPWDRVSVIYNGVAGPSGLSGPPSNGPPTVGCIGRIAPEKGQLEFVKSAALVHRSMPECRFVLYGAPMFADPLYQARVREAAAGLPIEFAGWTKDVYAAMERLDVLLVPSARVEATTRVILEAFAAGLPVIAFGVGGIPEVVEHGVDGLLVNSPEEMARETIMLLQNVQRRNEISRAARETWSRRFTLERYQEEVLRVLETASTRKRGDTE